MVHHHPIASRDGLTADCGGAWWGVVPLRLAVLLLRLPALPARRRCVVPLRSSVLLLTEAEVARDVSVRRDVEVQALCLHLCRTEQCCQNHQETKDHDFLLRGWWRVGAECSSVNTMSYFPNKRKMLGSKIRSTVMNICIYCLFYKFE